MWLQWIVYSVYFKSYLHKCTIKDGKKKAMKYIEKQPNGDLGMRKLRESWVPQNRNKVEN